MAAAIAPPMAAAAADASGAADETAAAEGDAGAFADEEIAPAAAEEAAVEGAPPLSAAAKEGPPVVAPGVNSAPESGDLARANDALSERSAGLAWWPLLTAALGAGALLLFLLWLISRRSPRSSG
jgi:hypothetical protein